MSYRVSFVDDQEFESLPGKDMVSKIGVAYPESGEAYIRKSGSSLIDVFTLAHELEHLEGESLDEHYDSENKAYYKKFGDAFSNVGRVAAPALGFMLAGPTGAMAASSMHGFASNIVNPQKQKSQGNMMEQFQQPGQSYSSQSATPSMESAQPASPATSTPRQFQSGAGSPGVMEGGMGGGMRLAELARSLIGRQSQSGFYSGRQPYGGF